MESMRLSIGILVFTKDKLELTCFYNMIGSKVDIHSMKHLIGYS